MSEPGDERTPAGGSLRRPPSDRYRTAAPADGGEGAAAAGSVARAVGFALIAGVVALGAYWVLAGPLSFTAGLVVAGIFAGRVIRLSARAGGGTTVPPDRVVVIALLVTLAWFGSGQVLSWLFAQSEGGVLPLLDYLGAVYGPIVPLVAITSVLAAWWSAR